MSSNLIQNYIASKQITPAQPAVINTDVKPKPDFNIQQELHNRNFLKPLKGKGRLVSGNILLAPKQKIDNISYNLRALSHAKKGQANDHELGKINDVGLVTGGLAIAAYLTTKRTTPMTKGMEFIGLGGFLASMALWPKIAIQLPAYLIHGVNVQKQYKDSFGRTKPFYQDPQFIPWDLYTDEQIEKIGNRMNVPKDIPNRRDFIQEKMKKLAVQNNTLWLLTAGFATPVMTALMCNLSEPYLAKFMNDRRNAKADAILKEPNKAAKKYQTHDIENGLKILSKTESDKPINSALIEKISDLFTAKSDFITSESFKKDLTEFLSSGKYSISEESAKNIASHLPELFDNKGFTKEFLQEVLPNEETLVNLFKEKGFAGQSLKPVEFINISNTLVNLITENIKRYNSAHPDLAEDIEYIRTLLNGKNNPIMKELKRVPSDLFDATNQAKLNDVAKILDDFQAKNLALDECALLKVGSAPETVIANYWIDTEKEFLNILGITQKDLEKIKFDKNLLGDLLREKIETITADETTYKKVMKKLTAQIATLDSRIKTSDMTSHLLRGENPEASKTTYEKAVDSLFDTYADALERKGFSRTAISIKGHYNDSSSYKNIQKAFVEERLLGVKSSFYRLISTLDFYRRAASNPNGLQSYNRISRETKEELIELCKTISLRGHSSDYATKFYMQRNPHPADDYSNIEVENGRIKYKYFGQAKGTADIPGDKYFYQNAMKFMHGDEMHPDTLEIINENAAIKDEIRNYRRLVFEKIGGEHYFYKPRHKVSTDRSAGSDIKSLLTGIAPEEMFCKTGQQMYNTKKWLSIFGKFGAVLFGVTVLSQFFLGRLKAPKGGRNA